jgi:hypothetical protein
LPELIAAPLTAKVHITEGEKDADALAKLSFVTTINSGGAANWSDDPNEYFRDRHVYIHEDNDDQSFEAKGDLADIHKHLLQDGIAFHTLVPHKGGATVYAVVIDPKEIPSTVAAADKAAERYDGKVTTRHGRGEFFGVPFDQPGSDREQRDAARSIYESNIRQSTVPGSEAIWQGIRDHWGKELVAAKFFANLHLGIIRSQTFSAISTL